uniref:Uncharacterized protein n=1 Tax=Tetranychus urticae TaxID=32264 RepID=T1JVQ0_TETUR
MFYCYISLYVINYIVLNKSGNHCFLSLSSRLGLLTWDQHLIIIGVINALDDEHELMLFVYIYIPIKSKLDTNINTERDV